jgi:2-methylcitrate dehydratase PrpD
MTLAERLAHALVSPIGTKSLDAARRHLFDALVAAIVGARSLEAARVRAAMGGRHAREGLELSFVGLRTLEPADAAAALCRLIRTTEVDDIQLASCTTPAAIVVPAALAATPLSAERSAEHLLSAIALGYDVVFRLGRAIGGPDHLFSGGWPTLAVASASAAATVAALLGASKKELADGLALGAQASPRARPRAEEARLFALGAAVSTGLEAAIAATAGTCGDLASFDELALSGAASDVPEAATALADEPPGSGVVRTSFKRFCSAAQAASAIEAAGRLVSSHEIAPDELARVVVEVPPHYARMIDRPVVSDRIASMLSVQHGIALRLVDQEGLFDCIRSSPREKKEAVASMRDLVEVWPDPRLAASYPTRWRARVTMEAQGRFFSLEDDGPTDASFEELGAKAARLIEANRADADVASLQHAVQGFTCTDELLEALDRCTTPTPASAAGSPPALEIDEVEQEGPAPARVQARARQ